MSEPIVSRAEPFYFGPPERPRAGWLHRASAPSGGGVVVCNPFGYEAICAHRSLRRLAESLASAGMAVLRFDYDGTGDSAGDDRDPDRLGAWVASTVDACRALRDVAGVEHVWLVGLRLGALVAALAAAEAGAAGLVAIAPVVSGRIYLRELAVLQSALDVGEPPPNGAALEEGAQEAAGFVLTSETRAALGKVDLARLERPLADTTEPFEVLVIDRDDLPVAERWVAHLNAQGARVAREPVPGYTEMMRDPHKSVVPSAILRTTTEWIAARARARATSGARTPGSELRRRSEQGTVIEELVFVDADRRSFGVLSTPARPSAPTRTLLFLNAGAIHHVGPNRLWVTLARRWAAMGYAVLRLDLSGLGESLPRPRALDNEMYGELAIDDVRDAVAWLRRERSASDVRALGLCSGAYHAYKSAASGVEIEGFVAINPITFRHVQGEATDFPSYRVVREAARYQRAMLDIEKWKKLLRGEVHVRIAAETMARHATGKVTKVGRELSRRLGVPWKDDIGATLERLARRGVDQRFVFSRGDPGLPLLHDGAGSVVKKLQRRGALAIDVIDGPDHTFTPIWSHGVLIETLTRAIDPGRRAVGARG